MLKKFKTTSNTNSQGNKNVLLLGSSGSGKTCNFIIPKLLKADGSCIITDRGGFIFEKTIHLIEQKYDVKILNLQEMKCSNMYNPLDYIETPTDIDILVNIFINNTTNGRKSDAFWDNYEKKLYTGIIHLMKAVLPKEEQTMPKMLDLIREIEVDTYGKLNGRTMTLINNLKKKHPYHIAVKLLNEALAVPAGTINSFLTTCFARCALLNTPEVINLLNSDSHINDAYINLNNVSVRKTALFIILPCDGNDTYNFIASLLCSQLLNILYKQGQYNDINNNNCRLDYPINFLLDTPILISNFAVKYSTSRKYGISYMLSFNSIKEMENMYENDYVIFEGNSDTIIYLGGNDAKTIDFINGFVSKTISRYEIVSLSKNKCIVIRYGEKPQIYKKPEISNIILNKKNTNCAETYFTIKNNVTNVNKRNLKDIPTDTIKKIPSENDELHFIMPVIIKVLKDTKDMNSEERAIYINNLPDNEKNLIKKLTE